MGGRGSKPGQKTACPHCPESAKCDPSKKKRDLLDLFNRNLRAIADKPLGAIGACPDGGTLGAIELCNSLVSFQVPTKVVCDLKVTLLRVEGLETLEVIDINYLPVLGREEDEVPDSVAVLVKLKIGYLRGTIRTAVVKTGCKWVSQAVTGLAQKGLLGTNESPITIGDATHPNYLTVAFGIELSCDRQVVHDSIHASVKLELSRLTIESNGLAGLLPQSATTLIAEKAAAALSGILEAALTRRVHDIASATLNALPWCRNGAVIVAS